MFILGLDGLSPKILVNLVREGALPNFEKMLRNGVFAKTMPAIPAQTPENWTTIATGAWPGTHGIAVWGRHDPGDSVMNKKGDEAMSSNLCRAEYLWEAAGRQGLKSIVFYFVGYPPTTDMAIYFDWFWRPQAFFFEICSAACYMSYPSVKKPGKAGRIFPVKFREAEGWASLPDSTVQPLEAEIRVEPKIGGEGVTYHVLIFGEEREGYDRCLISKEKDAGKSLAVLKPGEWTDWFREVFRVEGEKKIGTVRFKLVELSPDGSRFLLYRSQVYPTTGFSSPPEVSGELVKMFGPYINEAAGRLFLRGPLDEETFKEEFEYHIKWIAGAAQYLMDKYDASIFVMHWHFLDTLHHGVLGQADPEGSMFDPEKADEARRVLRLGYQMADRLVGEFLKILDENTYLFVVSDHGDVPNRKKYSIVRALAKRGLVHVEKTPDGRERVDWSRSKVFVDLTNVYINLKSRYAGGIVEDDEYEDVRREVIDVLRSCKDQDGEYVVLLALKREDAPLIGLWGPYVGDVVFVYNKGFTWGVDLNGERSMLVGGANHGPQPPTAETAFSSNYAAIIAVGPGLKKGYVRPVDLLGPAYTVDVAPTVSYLLGIKPPRHSQGRVLYDFMEGWDVSPMKRKRVPLRFPRAPTPLRGDVTDQ